MRSELLWFKNASASAGPLARVEGLWLTLFRGEAVGLFGQHNAAPGVLAQLLCGAIPLAAGSAVLEGRPYQPQDEAAAQAAGVVRIHNQNIFSDSLSIAENLFILRPGGLKGFVANRRVMTRQTRAILDMVELDIPASCPGARLTGPQKQLLELGKALAGGARLVVFDLAFGEYTTGDLIHLQRVVHRYKAQGITFVLHCAHLEELRLLADRVLLFRGSRISKKLPVAGLRAEDVARYLLGRDSSPAATSQGPSPGPLLGKVAAHLGSGTLPITPRRGEILGLVCRNSEERAALVEALRTALPALGCRAAAITDLWGESALFPNLTVAENLMLPSLKRVGRAGVVGSSILGYPLRQPATRELAARGDVQCLDYLQRIQLQFERWLLHRPDVLLVAEPFLHSDAASEALVGSYLRQLVAGGTAVLLASVRHQQLDGVCGQLLYTREAEA